MIKAFLVLLVVVFAAAATKNETSGVHRRLLSKDSRRNLGECYDNLRHKDSWGDSCEDYKGNKHWCGNFDTVDFKSNEHCCACGGGKKRTCKTFVNLGKYYCAWNGVDKEDRASLGGGGHAFHKCEETCRNSESCNWFSFRGTDTDGYCHMFKTCNGRYHSEPTTLYQKSC